MPKFWRTSARLSFGGFSAGTTFACIGSEVGAFSTDAEFGPKAADVVGLYLNPPQNALVLSVDEKPSIQALERAQGYLRLPDRKAVNGYSHCYKRHGTTTLFAALEITTGLAARGATPL